MCVCSHSMEFLLPVPVLRLWLEVKLVLFDSLSKRQRKSLQTCRALQRGLKEPGLGFGSPVLTAVLGGIWSDLGVVLLEIRFSGGLDVCRTLTAELKWRFWALTTAGIFKVSKRSWWRTSFNSFLMEELRVLVMREETASQGPQWQMQWPWVFYFAAFFCWEDLDEGSWLNASPTVTGASVSIVEKWL